jgi:hypothetical protein
MSQARVTRLDELLERPVLEGDADDRALEEPTLLQSVQGAEGHDARKVAREDIRGGRRRAVRPTLPLRGSSHDSRQVC